MDYLNSDIYIIACEQSGVSLTDEKPKMAADCDGDLGLFVQGIAEGINVFIQIELDEARHELLDLVEVPERKLAEAAARVSEVVDYALESLNQPYYLVRLQLAAERVEVVTRIIQAESDRDAHDKAMSINKSHLTDGAPMHLSAGAPHWMMLGAPQWLSLASVMNLRNMGML